MSSNESGRRAGTRHAALEILLQAETEKRFVDEALSAYLESDRGQPVQRDRRLLQELVYGTARYQNTLDRVLSRSLKWPMSSQRKEPRWALRLGAFQIVYLSRVPAHAALDQTLEGLKALPRVPSKTVGFVNAVLRNVVQGIREKTEAPPADPRDPSVLPIRQGFCYFRHDVLPDHRKDAVSHLAIKHSLPGWLVERWLDRFGEEEAEPLCVAHNRVPQLAVRITSKAPSREALAKRLEEEGYGVAEGTLPDSLILQRVERLGESPAFRDGWFQVQDETAQQIGAALNPPAGARVLDLCASPGGKTTQLIESVGESGLVVAADRSEEKLVRLRETIARVASPGVTGTHRVALVPDEPSSIALGEEFTHVLVDAPCSNTGVLARRPEARWRIARGDLKSLARLGRGLLEAGLRHLAPGGRLLYSTCSIEPEENESVIAASAADHPELEELATKLFLPHRTGSDGGYYSLLLKRRG